MADIGPSCPGGPLCKLRACLLESGSLSQSDHLFVDDKLDCGSGGFLGKDAVALRNE
jgi:hypothetical protein